MKKRTLGLFVLVLLVAFASTFVLFAQEKKADDKSATVTGTLVDLTCYAKAGFLTNDHGGMKNCGSMCAKGGLPVGVVDSEENVHLLAAPSPGYADYIGEEVKITGQPGKHADVLIPETLEIKEGDKWVKKELPKTMM